MSPPKLTEAERQAHLPALGETGWTAAEGRDAIRKVWAFRNFSEAWGFMSRAALVAEKLNKFFYEVLTLITVLILPSMLTEFQ